MIRKHLKGEKPKSVTEENDKTIITNRDGNLIYAPNIFYKIYKNNGLLRGSINKNFGALNKDKAITGFELKDLDGKLLFHIL